MTHLSNTPDDVVEETQTRAGTAVCTTTNAFYCSYINKLRASAPYCSSAALSNQLYQQCCSAYSTNPLNTAPTPVPSIYSSPTAPAVPSVLSNPINQSNCGISSTNPATRMAEFSEKMNQMRIVGGVNTEKCEYPWMVRLRVGNGMCGGSIIDAYHIVTAAHCVGTNPASTIGVHAGEYDYNNPYETNDQTVKAAAVIKHPNYRDLPNGEQENDIAIIKLAQPLQFNNCVQPICLANDGDGVALPSGTQCTIAGWGTTSSGGQASPILQETTIPTYNGFECSKYFSSTVPSNPNIQLCAGRPVIGGADTCQGDSGGPLFCPINGRYVQYGVVSYGAGCASAGAAGVYTDVGKMRPFIDSVINSGNGK
ncbi:trypsin-2-like [Patella vulgata]|uniref:trypsin-2-like n=1 Tax=Patella vulgata TaxID=6465 RepID=UPI0024A9947C|nr:trypsin-2-like [Patella vulgata]